MPPSGRIFSSSLGVDWGSSSTSGTSTPSKARAPSMYREDPHTLLSIYLRVDLLSRGQRPAVETLMSGNPECILDPKALTKDEAIVF